jgi:hypothetical protein
VLGQGPESEEEAMNACEVCGNIYDKPLTVEQHGESHVFDCFACAIQALAPRCATCDTFIIGHGMEASGAYYCCAHCARGAGKSELVDRA